MKKILLLILVALVTYSSSFAIGGFKVVIKKPGVAVDVQVRIVDYAPTGPTTLYTGPIVSLTPNASGIIVASVPETDGVVDPVNIPAVDVTSYYIVEVWTGNPLALSSQQRLDEMIFEQAKTGLTDNEGNVTLEPGKELIFPEPSGNGENFTSFKSPALASDVEYTLPIDDGNANQYLKTDGSGVMSWDNPTVTSDASLTGDGAGTPLSLANGAVTTDKIGSSAVTDIKIGASAVTTAKINNAAVTTDKIANGAVTTDKIGSSAVTDVKIGASAVTTAKINNAAVTTDKINDGAVTEAKLADDAVATAKIEDKAVTAPKIDPDGATAGHVLTVSGTDAVWAAPAGGGGGGCNIYGDGSAGDVTINSNTDWSTTPPTNGNYMFNSLTIASGVTLTVASGTIIQSKTTVINNGTILVAHGTLGDTWVNNQDVLGSTRGSQDAYPSAEVYRRVFKFGPKGGSAGLTGDFVGNETLGGNGGGTLSIFAATGITNAASGTISAQGQTPTAFPGGNDKPGCGGGGGGFVVLATNSTITNSGTINVSGGNGNAAGDASDDFGGAGGGGGLVHYISTNASSVGGTTTVSGGLKGGDDSPSPSSNGGGDGGAGAGNAGKGSYGTASTNGSAGAVLRTEVADACSFINN